MTVPEAAFVAALLDPSLPPPEGLTDPAHRPAGKRFDIYRNNVVASLAGALETGFPVIRKLLGDGNFRALAGIFLRQEPPRSPLLLLYGDGFPEFLEGRAELARFPYLGDVARLELALRRSYHAGDAHPVDPATLAGITPEARLTLAPAVQVLSSRWPVLGIWCRNTQGGAPVPAIRPEDVLIVRPVYDPEPVSLRPGGAAFVSALARGETVDAALERAGADFDLATTLCALVRGAAITSVEID